MLEEKELLDDRTGVTYIITEVTGHLGGVVARYLCKYGKKVTGLILPGEKSPFPGISTVYGDITDKDSLRPLFASASKRIVIHCAGQVSISSYDALSLWNINVIGTRNIVDLAVEYGVKKFIYVSSVHAIPELPDGTTITEATNFRSADVVGDYAKTKAAATEYVREAAENGFPACVVHPSGIIGPYDSGTGQISSVPRLYLKNRLPAGVTGGYDFVDVRDVAKEIVSCCEKGRDGEYIPLERITPLAAFWERTLHFLGKKTVFTSYSLYTLGTNGNFSYAKASKELGYVVRDREQTIRDMVRWTFRKMRRQL